MKIEKLNNKISVLVESEETLQDKVRQLLNNK